MGADDQDKPRRPGAHWSDEDRAHVGRRKRPVHGVPIVGTPPPAEPADEVTIEVDGASDDLDRAVGPDIAMRLRELAEELTPRPVDVGTLRRREPTPGESWEHADHVNKRVVDLLMVIAKQSGAGMAIGDEIRKLDKSRRLTIGISIGSLLSVIATLIAVGAKLYGAGVEAGEARSWKTNIERAVEKLGERIDRLDNRIDRIEGRRSDARPDFKPPGVAP